MNQSISNNLFYRFKRVLIISAISFIITLAIVLIRQRYNFSTIKAIDSTLFFGFSFGFLIGLLDDILLYSKLSKWDYKYRTLLKVTLIPLFVLFILIILAAVKNNIGNKVIVNQFVGIFENAAILDIFLLAFLTTIFNEINLILGDNFLWNYVSGNIKGPVQEDRIFMFLDLKDSTTIAEKIGDIKFYELLNDCYTMLGTVSIQKNAEIVKYVGDEAILTWKYSSSKKSKDCITLFYDFKALLEKQKEYFITKYGFHPRFTASAHHGQVISAYLGSVKRQKDYSGDVMNTTARIEGLTTKFNAELLISEDLFIKLNMEEHEGEKIEAVPLKGKENPINIYKLS